MNSQARKAIENGFTSQLMTSVTPMPLTCPFTWLSAPKSIFSSIGMIITQISRPTGRLTLAISIAPTARKTPGISWPRTMPTTMQMKTQTVR